MKQLAKDLLAIRAVKIQPYEPFTWASGWTSPFYCDNRKLNSYPQIRNYLKLEIARCIREFYPQVQAIAGVATGAVPMAAIVADLLGLPFVYIRPSAKDHGKKNQIEGELLPNINNYVIIEDLISTGGSSIKALNALRGANTEINVLGMVALFTYGFPQAIKAFEEADCRLITVTNYQELIEVALTENLILPEEEDILDYWRIHPDTWKAPKK